MPSQAPRCKKSVTYVPCLRYLCPLSMCYPCPLTIQAFSPHRANALPCTDRRSPLYRGRVCPVRGFELPCTGVWIGLYEGLTSPVRGFHFPQRIKHPCLYGRGGSGARLRGGYVSGQGDFAPKTCTGLTLRLPPARTDTPPSLCPSRSYRYCNALMR